MTSKHSTAPAQALAPSSTPSQVQLLQPKAPPLKLWKPQRRLVAPPIRKATLVLKPSWAADGARKGLKGRGCTYERSVRKALKKSLPYDLPLMTSIWVEYEDGNGKGIAAPDAVILRRAPALSLVIEVKLTRSADGPVQLSQLYLPLCQHLWPGRRWGLVHVFKHWAGAELAAHPIANLSEAVELEVCDLYLPNPRLLGALQIEPLTHRRTTGP